MNTRLCAIRKTMEKLNIGVMCGSSNACPKKYLELAYEVGQLLGRNNKRVVYGGGAKGLMSQVANGALEVGAEVHGYIPEFMIEVEWQHKALTKLFITKSMSERKTLMMQNSDATLFLPGGCGTMEEFFEWLSSKRLGRHKGPLIIYNFEKYYDPLIELLHKMEKEKFHNPEHTEMWTECNRLEDLIDIIDQTPHWAEDAIKHASVKN